MYKTRVAALAAALAVGGAVLLGAPATASSPVTAASTALAAKAESRYPLAGLPVYFVMTDRYANGDTSNDRGSSQGNVNGNGFAPTDPGYFHGGDLKGLTGDCTGPTGLARIKNLGFKAVWITPPFGQNTVQGGSAAYHGYWIDKFDQIDPHFGTLADFAAFTGCAKQLGLKVIVDIVVNHTGDVIYYSGNDYSFSYAAYKDSTGKAFDPLKYTTGVAFPSLNLNSFPKTPLLPVGQENVKSPAWANDVLNYHNRGNLDFNGCNDYTCRTMGDFAGLDDLFTEKFSVMKGLADVYGYWAQNYPIAAFRIDTAPYSDQNFFKRWLPIVQTDAKAGGNSKFTVFGEDYNSDTYETSAQVRDRNLPSVLDFPFQQYAMNYASGQHSAYGLGSTFVDDDMYTTATTNAYSLETFLGNHDMGRVGCLLMGDGFSGTTLTTRDKFAHDLLFLLRGNPVVYYGDEVGMTGGSLSGLGCGDKAARQDMFPTAVTAWQNETRVGGSPIGTGSGFDATATNPIAQQIVSLTNLRKRFPVLATGAQIVRRSVGPVLAVSRIDAAARNEYVVAFNNSKSATTVTFPTSTASAIWVQEARSDRTVKSTDRAKSAKNGNLTVTVPAVGFVVLKAAKKLPGGTPKVSSLTVTRDDLSNLWITRANVTTPDPATVTFLTQVVGSKKWVVAGVDDAAPYRVFLDPAKFAKGAKVAVQALVRSTTGQVTRSPILVRVLH